MSSQSSFHPGRPRGGEPREEESLRDVIRILRKRAGMIALWGVAFLLLALLYCALTKNVYTSTATLLVDKQGSSGVDVGSLSGIVSGLNGEGDLKTELTTHATVLESDTTTLMVIERLGLDKVYAYKPGLLGWNGKIKAELGQPLNKATATRERLLHIVEGALKVEPQEDTRLITVRYTDTNPQRAADVANAFVDAYIREYLEDHYEATARASDWLNGKLDELKSRVNDSQQKLSDYESKTGLSVLMLGFGGGTSAGGAGSSSGMGGSAGMHVPAIDKLALLNQELTAAQSDLITKEAIYELTQSESPDVVIGLGTSSLVTGAAGSTVVSEGQGLNVLENLRTQQGALEAEYGDYATKYGAHNQHLIELRGQIDGLNQAIKQELARINERAKNDMELARKTEQGIQAAYDSQQAEVNKLNDNTIQLEVLAGEALSNRELYQGLYTRLHEASIQAGVSATNLDLVDEARPTSTPTKPNWRLYPVLGCGLGLFLGVVLAFMSENLDESIVTAEQVEKTGLLPVLSYIPLVRPEDFRRGREPGEALPPGVHALEQSTLISRPTSPVAEAYRTLRTAILLSAADDPLRVLLITSPLGGDGKTTVSYNLAIAFAQHGRRVLLIDGDMRKASIHTLFRVDRMPGLSEALTGGTTMDAAVVRHPTLENLSLLPAGTTPPNAAELLDSRRFETLLEEAKGQYDLVLIDSPPVMMVTDPVILSTKSDGTIVVLRSQKTTRPVLKRTVEVLSQSFGRKLGFVINGLDTKSVEHYYSYGYYGYNRYYGEEG